MKELRKEKNVSQKDIIEVKTKLNKAVEENEEILHIPESLLGHAGSLKVDKSALRRQNVAPASKPKNRIGDTALGVPTATIANRQGLGLELDLRGKYALDAVMDAENFIDNAVMAGLHTISIIHGKGTGALKEEIRRYLRTVDLVRSTEDEHVDMGGAGITVVKLDL